MRKLRSAASGVLQAPLPTRQTPSPWRRPPLAHHSLSGHPPLPVRPPSASPPSRHACRTLTTPPGLSRSRHVLPRPAIHPLCPHLLLFTYSLPSHLQVQLKRGFNTWAAYAEAQRQKAALGKRVLSSMKARRSRPPSSFPSSRRSIPSTASYPLLHHPLPYSYPPPPTACPPPHPPLLPGEPDESRRRTLPLLTWQGLAKAFNMWWAETEKWHRMHTIAASFAHRPKRKALNAWCAVARPREAPTVFTHCFTRRKPLALAGSNARSRTRSESGFSPRRRPRCARSARPFSSLHAVPRTGG